MRPDVQARTQTQREWVSATLGQALFRLDEVSTLKRAGADLTFRDQTHLYLRENALVIISSQSPGREALMAPTVELISGATRLSLADLRAPATFDVKSAGTRVSAQGAEVLVEVDEIKTNRVSVHAGQTTVAAGGRQVSVSKGQGTRVFHGEAPESPRALLPSPGLEERSYFFEQVADVRWSPVSGAVRYRLEVATDSGFHNLLTDEQTAQTSSTTSLPLGTSWLRVSAADEAGLWSIPSEAQRIDTIIVTGVNEVGPARLAIAGRANDVALSLDGELVEEPLEVNSPGPHQLEFAGPGGRAKRAFVIQPPPGRFERQAEQLLVVAQSDGFTVTRDDDAGDFSTPIEIGVGHEWKLRWHGVVVDVFREPLRAAKGAEPPPEHVMATPVVLRDRRVGRMKSPTPWLPQSRFEAQLLGESGETASALLGIRYEPSFFERLGLLVELVGAVGPTSSLDATIGVTGALVQRGLFRVGASVMGSLNLVRSKTGLGPTVRGLGLLSAGALGSDWAASADGGFDVSDEPSTQTVFVGGRVGAHAWREVAPRWVLLADLELGLKGNAREVNFGFALSRQVGPANFGVALTYRLTTFEAGLSFIAGW